MEEIVEITPGFATLIAAVTLPVLMSVGDVVDMSPTLLGCILRAKENINLYNNMRMRRTRIRLSVACIPAVIVVLSRYPELHPFITESSWGMQLFHTALIVLGYILSRILSKLIFCQRSIRTPDFQCAAQVSFTFTVIGAIVLFFIFGIMKVIGIENASVASAIQWAIGIVYFVFIVREYQVFTAHRGYLSSFLYLCALEVLPAAMLVASYHVF